MKMKYCAMFVVLMSFSLMGAECQDSDRTMRDTQEKLLLEANAQVGLPAVKNFREKKILKDIYELRDQEGLVTYTYLWNELNGKLIFLGETIGYGIPYSTQFSNPEKVVYSGSSITLPQAEPNGLFSPASAEGTWILMRDPVSKKTLPVYVEPRIIVSPFKLTLGAN